jgi:Protein of unknown function (DUF1638)
MSSSPTEMDSTTRSSSNFSSRPDGGAGNEARSLPEQPPPTTLAVIACGALAGHVRDIAARRGWPVEAHALRAAVALGYADCGSYGALDELCASLRIGRLRGLHCYDVLGGADRVRALLAREPGTYLLTDYLVRSFDRTVMTGLGLDRHPELWADYFGHYRRLVWLAQDRDEDAELRAAAIAARFGLPLRTIDVGTTGLERELAALLAQAGLAEAGRADAGRAVPGEPQPCPA